MRSVKSLITSYLCPVFCSSRFTNLSIHPWYTSSPSHTAYNFFEKDLVAALTYWDWEIAIAKWPWRIQNLHDTPCVGSLRLPSIGQLENEFTFPGWCRPTDIQTQASIVSWGAISHVGELVLSTKANAITLSIGRRSFINCGNYSQKYKKLWES